MTRITGAVLFKPTQSLADTARLIGEALGGIDFSQELTGKYEEYPAYVGYDGAVEFALLGPPDLKHDIRDEPDDHYVLQISGQRAEAADQPMADLTEHYEQLFQEKGLGELVVFEQS